MNTDSAETSEGERGKSPRSKLAIAGLSLVTGLQPRNRARSWAVFHEETSKIKHLCLGVFVAFFLSDFSTVALEVLPELGE